MNNFFTIGKAAKQINVNPRTLRFYEQVGLIYPSNRSQTGYRLYSPSDLEVLWRSKKNIILPLTHPVDVWNEI